MLASAAFGQHNTIGAIDFFGYQGLDVAKVRAALPVHTGDRLSDQTKPQMAVIDTATNKVKTWIPLPGLGYGSAATPDGRWLVVAVPTAKKVAVVDLAARGEGRGRSHEWISKHKMLGREVVAQRAATSGPAGGS